MRYGLILLIAALLGAGEYAFVEYYPISPQRRVQKFQKLPIVKQIVLHKEKTLVEQAFAEEADGILSYRNGTTTYTWNSVGDWFKQRKAGSRRAASLVNRLEFEAQARNIFTPEGGFVLPVHPMGHLGHYMAAKSLRDAKIMDEVVERWKSDPSATAQWMYKMYHEQSLDTESKEGMLLTAQMSIENLKYPGMKESFFKQESERNQNTLDIIWSKSDAGDESAKWVTDQLDTRLINAS